MLLSGVESLLDSSVCAVIEELCTGLPESISTELMAVSEPNVGLDAKSGVSMPVLGHSDSLSAEHHRTSAAENFCQKTEDLGDLLKVISHGPAESLTEALLKAGDLEKDETNKKRNFRKLDCCSDGYQKEDKEAQVAEDYHAECCALTPGESGSEQENPHLQQHEVKSWTMCGTGTAGSPKSTGGKQASIQVTAETLPKLTEEVQGMKADGTRIVSKAGCRKDRVSKGLPPESTECPETGTVTARAGLSGTSTLGFLEPLKGTDIESAPEHPQETSEYRGLRACAAMPLRAGGDVVPALQTREEKLRGQNPGNEFGAPLANCQTYQQDEESSASGEPLRLSSVESCRTLSTESSEVICSVLKSFCYLDCRNMPLEKQSTAVHGTVTETSKKDLPKPIKNQALHDYGTGPVENQTSTSKPVEQTSVVRSKGLSSAKNDPVLSSAAASPGESSKGKFKMVPSEDSKLKKDQWQFSASDLFRDDVKTSSLLMEMSSIACPGAEQTDVGLYHAASEIPPPSSHICLDFSNKPEKNSPEAQLFQKESKSNTTSGELADSPAEATGATSDASSSSGKDADLISTLNVTLPPVAQKSREPHCKESPPCPASEFSSRDKAQDNVPGKDSVCASGATREQVPEVVPHNDQFQSSGSSRTFYNPTRSKKISQKNMKPSAGNPEPVVTAPENEQSAMGSCCKWSMREQCVAANASCVLSGSTCLGDVFQNSPYCHAEVDKNVEENGNLEGEASAAYHSKRAVTFPAAHFPRPLGSLPSEDAHSSRGTHPHGLKDTSTAKPRSCSAYTAKKPPAALVRGEVSNKSMEAVKGFDRGRVTGSSEIVCDNFGLCSSALGLKERELTMGEKEEVPVLPANTPECTAAVWGTLSLSVQTPHTSQTGQALCPVQNLCLAPGRDFGDPILGSKQHSESLNKPPTGLQTMATSVEGHKLSICSRQSEEILLKTRDDLPLLDQKCAREDSLQGPLKYKAVELDSLKGVRTQDCLECGGFGSHLPEEKTIKKQESRCEREGKGALEGNASGDKPHCSQQHLKEQAELPLAGGKPQPPLPKLKLGKEQGSTVSAPSLPCSSAQQSPLCKPENSQVLSERENQNCLRIKPTLNNSCLQLTLEPSTESDAQQGIDPSHPRNCDSQESFTGAEVDSGSPPAVSWGTSVSEKEKLCVIAEQTLTQNCGSASARGLNEDSSVTKPLPVATSVKRKASTAEMPSAGSDRAVCFLNGAKSSRVCGHSKESLRKERHSVLAPKDRDVTSKKRTRRGEKVKSTCVEEKMGREVAPRRKLPINYFPSGEDCLGVLLDDSKESGSETVPLSTENCGKVLDEIPRSNLNNLSKERNKDTQLPGLAGTSLLSEAVQGAHAEGAPDAETASGLQCRPAPTLPPRVSMRPGSCKEPPPSCVGGTEVCVPYPLHARSKDRLKGRARGQDTKPTHSARKERKPLGSKRLDQAEQCQVLQRKKQRGKVEAHLPDRAQPQQRSGCPEKAKITLQPHILHSSELLCSSSKELVTPRNGKLEGPSEEIFAVRTSKNKPCSTLQEVKRPKTTTDVISSQIVKTQDSEMENLNLNLGYDGIPGAFRTTNTIRGPLPLKIQPGRTCKKVPTLCQLKTVRKPKHMKSPSFSEVPTEVLPKQDKTLLKSLYLPHRAAVMEVEAALSFVRVPGQSARRCSLLSSLKFRKCTKEPALLSRLSAMASNLLAPAKGTHGLEALPYPSEILPVAERCSQRRSKNLLEAFSCINRSLHSRWADSWCTKMFSFQPLALYPLESTKILFSDLSHKSPASSLDSLPFPVSFHIKLDSSPVPDLTGITSQHSLHHRPVQMASPPSEWTFSFLLSQSSSGLTSLEEGSSLNAELHSSHSVTTPGAPALHPDHGRNAVAGRRGGYSMLGLHTVLALSSPGCYRIWTRRRNLTSHIPTIQRLFISQFAQGLKGARHPPSVADDLASSLPYSLGRALSMWSQHGPSACLSEINPLHSSPCKWQPGVGIDNSYAMLPHLPVQSVEALQTAGHEIRLEASFPLLLPKPCSLPEPLPCPARLSASELQVHALNDADVSVPACLGSQDDTELKKTEPEKRPKKVSQIRIRKTVPKPDPNLTPMGLPKPKRLLEGALSPAEMARLDADLIKTLCEMRLKKKEFSLEEIYTNKNYKSPPPARSLETIFEEPKEKNGHFISVSQQKRKRILEFQDFTLPRKRRTRGKIKAMGSCTRAKRAALQSAELDALLSQKLMDLEAFFAKEAEQEQASGI